MLCAQLRALWKPQQPFSGTTAGQIPQGAALAAAPLPPGCGSALARDRRSALPSVASVSRLKHGMRRTSRAGPLGAMPTRAPSRRNPARLCRAGRAARLSCPGWALVPAEVVTLWARSCSAPWRCVRSLGSALGASGPTAGRSPTGAGLRGPGARSSESRRTARRDWGESGAETRGARCGGAGGTRASVLRAEGGWGSVPRGPNGDRDCWIKRVLALRNDVYLTSSACQRAVPERRGHSWQSLLLSSSDGRAARSVPGYGTRPAVCWASLRLRALPRAELMETSRSTEEPL